MCIRDRGGGQREQRFSSSSASSYSVECSEPYEGEILTSRGLARLPPGKVSRPGERSEFPGTMYVVFHVVEVWSVTGVRSPSLEGGTLCHTWLRCWRAGRLAMSASCFRWA